MPKSEQVHLSSWTQMCLPVASFTPVHVTFDRKREGEEGARQDAIKKDEDEKGLESNAKTFEG